MEEGKYSMKWNILSKLQEYFVKKMSTLKISEFASMNYSNILKSTRTYQSLGEVSESLVLGHDRVGTIVQVVFNLKH